MKLENNLDTDHIRELVWKLAFPSMLAQFVSVLYSIVDLRSALRPWRRWECAVRW